MFEVIATLCTAVISHQYRYKRNTLHNVVTTTVCTNLKYDLLIQDCMFALPILLRIDYIPHLAYNGTKLELSVANASSAGSLWSNRKSRSFSLRTRSAEIVELI